MNLHELASMFASYVTNSDNFQTEIVNGKIYAIGGRSLSSMEVYTVTASSENQLKPTGGGSRVDLTWNAVTDVSSYIVKRSTTAGGPYITIATDVTGATYTDTSQWNYLLLCFNCNCQWKRRLELQ